MRKRRVRYHVLMRATARAMHIALSRPGAMPPAARPAREAMRGRLPPDASLHDASAIAST